MEDYKYFLIAVCIIMGVGFGSIAFDSYLKSKEKQSQLEIKKLELQLKLKVK